MSTIFTVTQINNQSKNLIESNFSKVWIKGEVSKPKIYTSKHIYFILKDDLSEIPCVVFNYTNKLFVEDGQSVVILGNLTLYSQKGKYQFIVKDIFHHGIGNHIQRYNMLKKKLFNEGLFESQFKKKLPLYPSNIGILTSITGSVLRDMINIIKRRAPYVNIYLRNIPVQGKHIVQEIIDGFNDFKLFNNVDVVILARGGGSFEDLMNFNEELLVRKIFSFNVPVVSAIGHETDTTLCDLAADKRASTPSEAAEFVVRDSNDQLYEVDMLVGKIKNLVANKILLKENKLEYILAKIPSNPMELLNAKIKQVKLLINLINNKVLENVNSSSSYLINRINMLNLSNPMNIKKKGYSIVKIDDNIITDSNSVKINDIINIDFYSGNEDARIISKNKGR